MEDAILINTLWGLSPVNSGVALASNFDYDIIVSAPADRVEWMRNHLRERFEGNPNLGRVYIETRIPEIKKAATYVDDIYQFVRNYPRAYKNMKEELLQHIKSFEAISLEGERKTFRRPSIELNLGTQISSEADKVIYYFPFKLTDHFSEWALRPTLKQLTQEEIDSIAEPLRAEEELYSRVYLNWPNTYTYREKEMLLKVPKERYVPLWANFVKDNSEIKPGIYAGVSGTGIGKDLIMQAAKKVMQETGLQVYTIVDVGEKDFIVKPDGVLTNDNILAFLGLQFWGYGSLAIPARKPMIGPTYQEQWDPEIWHENMTARKLGYGFDFTEEDVEKPGFGRRVVEEAERFKPNLEKLNQEYAERFPPVRGISHLQGIDYAAKIIADDFGLKLS